MWTPRSGWDQGGQEAAVRGRGLRQHLLLGHDRKTCKKSPENQTKSLDVLLVDLERNTLRGSESARFSEEVAKSPTLCTGRSYTSDLQQVVLDQSQEGSGGSPPPQQQIVLSAAIRKRFLSLKATQRLTVFNTNSLLISHLFNLKW